ncbi:DUF3990 domain-containing protein [Cohnella zeiphila]|uniref:DUF3990 domain-containing protein n=1 Tax=Cohnella zeiphila TaxID=2761120 RepID=A0A7X0SPD6_9BACL|nr:DUF3990 domain-containing protein [Cohnella zeiphila]MBB6732435.1 DUF3990 domain-containing protein [Cohnella zeiphila]
MDIITPQLLFHGTIDSFVPSFRRKLLRPDRWRPGRDFGEGLYTTISAAQARKWATKVARDQVGDARPCVLEIEMVTVPSEYEPVVFLSESLAWAGFILKHRMTENKGVDPCARHPDIVIGPMADSDTGKIVSECVKLERDEAWFYDQITRSSRGRRLDSLSLGNQVVFASEKWEQSLRLIGYYIHRGGRWIYHENANTAESI